VCVRANNLLFFFSSPFFKNSTIQHITYNIVLAFCFIVYTGLFYSLLHFTRVVVFFCVFLCRDDEEKKKLCISFCCFCFGWIDSCIFHSYEIDECLFVYLYDRSFLSVTHDIHLHQKPPKNEK